MSNKVIDLYPQIHQYYHNTKNNIAFEHLSVGSKIKIVWVCGNGHEFTSPVSSMVRSFKKGNSGCPYCSNRIVLYENSLSFNCPELMKEWDFEKNNKINPDELSLGVSKKVHWKCSKGHSWSARISHRVNGSGCPMCNNSSASTSFPELSIYYYLKKIFPNAKHRYKVEGYELDIFLPDFNLGIEYDGSYFHQDLKRDIKKNTYCIENGLTLIRVREVNCPEMKETDKIGIIIHDYKKGHDALSDCIVSLFKKITYITGLNCSMPINVHQDRLRIYELFELEEKENSIEFRYPLLAKEWHPKKNGELTPSQVSYGSDLKAWWICPEGHEYEAKIYTRTSGSGCPYCAGKKVCWDTSLEFHYPEISKLWHPFKNGGLLPSMVTPKSHQKVWWRCSCGEEWETSVKSQVTLNRKCKVCKIKNIPFEKSLKGAYPNLLFYWDFKKNDTIDPKYIYATTKKIVFWKCPCGHSWERAVIAQVRAKKCTCCGSEFKPREEVYAYENTR